MCNSTDPQVYLVFFRCSWQSAKESRSKETKIECAGGLSCGSLHGIHLPMQRTTVWSLVGQIPRAEEKRSPWATARGPVLGSLGTTASEPTCHHGNPHALEPVLPTREATAVRSPRTPTKSSACSQLEKSLHSRQDPAQPEINKNKFA